MENNHSSYNEHWKEIIDFEPDALLLIDRQKKNKVSKPPGRVGVWLSSRILIEPSPGDSRS